MGSECKCLSCVNACKSKPGWFLPGEAEKVAEHLKIPLKELFENHLGVDWYENFPGTDEPVFVLAPAIHDMDAGNEYPGNPRGVCVFLEEGLCKIHPVKPFECKELGHGEDGKHIYDKERHVFVARQWLGEQKQIASLLGREPETEDFEASYSNSFLNFFR